MELLIKTLAIGWLILNSGCDATKEMNRENQGKRQMTEQQVADFSSEGFSRATILRSHTEGCNYLLILEKSQEKLDPVNIDDEKFSEYKTVDGSIWIKFKRLRRSSRCPGANPVQLVEVKN